MKYSYVYKFSDLLDFVVVDTIKINDAVIVWKHFLFCIHYILPLILKLKTKFNIFLWEAHHIFTGLSLAIWHLDKWTVTDSSIIDNEKKNKLIVFSAHSIWKCRKNIHQSGSILSPSFTHFFGHLTPSYKQ